MANDNRGPENLADILGRLFTSRGWGRQNDRLRLEPARAAVSRAEPVSSSRRSWRTAAERCEMGSCWVAAAPAKSHSWVSAERSQP